MKKCGIVTLYGMENYGNRLQNYAIVNVLNKLGYGAINFNHVSKYYECKRLLCMIYKRQFRDILRRLRFLRFDKKTTTNVYCGRDTKNKATECSYFLCGSDQVWNPHWAGKPYLFASFAPPEKRISYAASFGVSEIPEKRKDEFTKHLNEMKAISVREHRGAEIVQELTSRTAEVVIDPTLMLSKQEWQVVSKKPSFDTSKKYVLTYFLSDISNETKNYIKEIQEKHEYVLINLEEKNKNKYWYKTGPAEFIWLIEHCELMLTDSFHGSVFSILTETPFVVFERTGEKMGSRIDTLLNTLNLKGNRFAKQSLNDILTSDFSNVSETLDKERKKTTAFLKNAMEEN